MRCPRLRESPVCGCCFAYPSRPWRVGGWRSSAGSGLVMPQSRSRSPQPPVTSPVLWLGARVCCPRPSVSTASARCCVGRALPRRAVPAAVPGAEPGTDLQRCCKSWISALPRAIPFLFYFFCFLICTIWKRKPNGKEEPGCWHEECI